MPVGIENKREWQLVEDLNGARMVQVIEGTLAELTDLKPLINSIHSPQGHDGIPQMAYPLYCERTTTRPTADGERVTVTAEFRNADVRYVDTYGEVTTRIDVATEIIEIEPDSGDVVWQSDGAAAPGIKPRVEVPGAIITVTKLVARNPMGIFLALAKKVNSTTFFGLPPWTVMFVGPGQYQTRSGLQGIIGLGTPGAEQLWISSAAPWQVNMEFHYRGVPGGHQAEYRNETGAWDVPLNSETDLPIKYEIADLNRLVKLR